MGDTSSSGQSTAFHIVLLQPQHYLAPDSQPVALIANDFCYKLAFGKLPIDDFKACYCAKFTEVI